MFSTLRTHPALLGLLLATAWAAVAHAERPAADDPHAGIACSTCHGARAVRAVAARGLDAPDPRSSTCRDCHRVAGRSGTRDAGGAREALGFHRDATADCTSCHSFHEPQRLQTAAGQLRIGSAGLTGTVPGHCAACHAQGSVLANLSPAHREAAALYHRDAALLAEASPSQGCLNCHAAGTTSDWIDAASERLTFNLHATHPLGVDVVPGSGQDERRLQASLDPRLRLFEGRIECQTCHSLTAATADLLVPFEQPYDLCLGCHQMDDSRQPHDRRPLLATMVALEKP